MGAMIDLICSRRSVRKFTEEQVGREQLGEILRAGSFAPSGSNSQSWRFTALRGSGLLPELNRRVKEAFLRTEFSGDAYPAKLAAKRNSAKEDYVFYYSAPVLIIVSNVIGYTNAMADSAAAIENMLLAAHALGLGACWINQLTWLNGDAGLKRFLQKELGLPQDHDVCGALAVGHANGEPPAAAPRREGVCRILEGDRK